MKKPKTTLHARIEIKGDFDVYEIYQDDNGKFITVSKNGYSNECTNGNRTLISAIQHVYAMIKTECTDRCLDDPNRMNPAEYRERWETTPMQRIGK